MDELGLSFSPASEPNAAGSNTNGNVSPQEAIRILSLRIPRTVGAASPIPSMLLNAPGGASLGGGGGMPGMNGMNLEMLLRQLFGQQAGMPSMPSTPSMPGGNQASPAQGFGAPPTPSVRPGVDNQMPVPRPIGSIEETNQPEPTAAPSMPFFREPAGPRDRRV